MGCILDKLLGSDSGPKEENEVVQETPQYSWDKRVRLDPKDFTIENLNNGMDGRVPGKINGQQFIIQNCQNAVVYLFDHINTISVDDCVGCKFFIGPVQTSIFIRDCKECQFVVSCQQFRTRDCHKLDVFLACVSQPIIEASSKIRFAPYQYYYPELEGHFEAAGLSVFNCIWSDIHDFTPVPGESDNYALLPESASVADYVPGPAESTGPAGDVAVTGGDLTQICVDLSRERSVVPRTYGKRRWDGSEERCLVVIFNDDVYRTRARKIIDQLCADHSDCVLMQSQEITMHADDSERVFGSVDYNTRVEKGPVIGLEYRGSDVIEKCNLVINTVVEGDTKAVYITSDKLTASIQIENFYNFVNMQMNTQ